MKKNCLLFLISLLLPGFAGAAVYHVDQKHEAASDKNPGTRSLPFNTISQAAKVLKPGDEVIVHEGVYRERVAPEAGGEPGTYITYRAAERENVYIKGSEIWNTGWRKIAPAVYEGYLDPALVKDYNPFATRIVISPPESKDTLNMVVRPAEGPKLERTLGQIFVDGIPQNQMESMDELLRTPRSFLVSPGGESIFVHFDSGRLPREHFIEITVRERIFAPHKRGLGYIRVKGFIMEHAANQGPFPQIAAVSSRSGHHWIFEYNTIRFAKTVGIDIGSECWGPVWNEHSSHHHLLQYNTISDNGLCGITGLQSENVVIRRNVVERNNRLGFYPRFDCIWWEQGGLKFHMFVNGVIEDNLIRDNDAFGVWLDNGNRGSRISRNLIVNNMWAGVFLELSCGPCTVDNNIIAYTRFGDGIYTHDAVNINLFHNLCYYNAHHGIWSWNVSDRKFGAHHKQPEYTGKLVQTNNIAILNNIIYGNIGGAVSLPIPHQRARDNHSDYNFIGGGGGVFFPEREPLFHYNVNNDYNSRSIKLERGASFQTLFSMMRELADSGKLADDSRPNLSFWKIHQPMTLPIWREISGNDTHSVAGTIPRHLIRSRDCELEIDIPDEFFNLRCNNIDRTQFDYFGSPILDENPAAGPIQKVKAGHQKYYLWPKKLF